MLDFFTIFSKGGILLWAFKGAGLLQKEWDSFTPAVNTFIKTVLLQEKSGNRASVFESGSLALKYRLDNEFELVFIVAYQKMLPLLYLDKLLDEIQLRFRDRFNANLKANCLLNAGDFKGFTSEFETTLRLVESSTKKADEEKKMRSFDQSAKKDKTVASMIISNNNNAKQTKVKTEKPGSAAKQAVTQVDPEPDTALPKEQLDEETRRLNLEKLANRGKKGKSPKADKGADKGKKPSKKGTTWDPFMFGGKGPTGEEARSLERTAPRPNNDDDYDPQVNVFVPDTSVVGTSSNLELYGAESSEDEEEQLEQIQTGKGCGWWSSLSSLVGNKSLTTEDIQPVISKMQDHLIAKNVAADVAVNLCNSVANQLEGKVMGTFSTIHRTVKAALVDSLMKLLTPRRRVDIIRDVYECKRNKRPYVMTFCGVNGVGKSTNLAKICFWLVENKCRVLIAACDTFRAGAVEQLRTHSKRINSLYPIAKQPDGKPVVELYEKGYGKDAAGIALEAINYARSAKIDVVLVDTAGRMQDNEPLMRALAKLISVNDPDLVLFVGEALVGNEAVDQLVKFNQALADHSPSANDPHLIDGIVLSKFDTIDDKVGSAISMTYITGQPILFVGTGQTYTDLKTLNSKAVVNMLMK